MCYIIYVGQQKNMDCVRAQTMLTIMHILPVVDGCEEIWKDSTTFKTNQVMLGYIKFDQVRFG